MEDLNGSMMAIAKQSINSDMIGISYRFYQNIVDLELSDNTVLVCAVYTFPLFVFLFGIYPSWETMVYHRLLQTWTEAMKKLELLIHQAVLR